MSRSLVATCARTAWSAALLTALSAACAAGTATSRRAGARRRARRPPPRPRPQAGRRRRRVPLPVVTRKGPAAAGRQVAEGQGRPGVLRREDRQGGRERYRRLNDHQVRTAWGISIDVVKEDDKFFYYKVYRPERRRPRGRAAQGPSPEEDRRRLPDRRRREAETLKLRAVQPGPPHRGPVAQRLRPRRHQRRRPPRHRARPGAQGARRAGHLPRRRQGELEAVAARPVPPPALRLRRRGGRRLQRRRPHGHGPRRPPARPAVLLGDGKGKFTDSSKGLDFAARRQQGQTAAAASRRVPWWRRLER